MWEEVKLLLTQDYLCETGVGHLFERKVGYLANFGSMTDFIQV